LTFFLALRHRAKRGRKSVLCTVDDASGGETNRALLVLAFVNLSLALFQHRIEGIETRVGGGCAAFGGLRAELAENAALVADEREATPRILVPAKVDIPAVLVAEVLGPIAIRAVLRNPDRLAWRSRDQRERTTFYLLNLSPKSIS